MRILVLSTLYPPFALGGYEVECSSVVERLRERHEVLVLTAEQERPAPADGSLVRRELPSLSPDWHGALRAPRASLRAVQSARRALAWKPDLVYCWNNASVAQAALRVLADSGVPLAFRVCEHWFAGVFVRDQYLRELLEQERSPARAVWARGCRALNRLPSLQLDPRAPLRTAISWNSEAIKRMVELQPFLEPVLERVTHSVPRYGDLYAAAVRDPAPEPEIMFLGRVTSYKGVSVAIEALAILRSEYDISASLVLLGPEDADHGAEMRALAERIGVAESLSWRGPSAPEQVVAGLERAHALIVPSVWQEPFPLVTIEGALARVPLVASDVGGISEGMHDEEHALLFPSGDARAAAAALARTLTEVEQTAARVERAHERAQAFRLGSYLDEQEQFVNDAHAALRAAASPQASGVGADRG
jgi:glycosyltransferase involved in cell wall biosynthesis